MEKFGKLPLALATVLSISACKPGASETALKNPNPDMQEVSLPAVQPVELQPVELPQVQPGECDVVLDLENPVTAEKVEDAILNLGCFPEKEVKKYRQLSSMFEEVVPRERAKIYAVTALGMEIRTRCDMKNNLTNGAIVNIRYLLASHFIRNSHRKYVEKPANGTVCNDENGLCVTVNPYTQIILSDNTEVRPAYQITDDYADEACD